MGSEIREFASLFFDIGLGEQCRTSHSLSNAGDATGPHLDGWGGDGAIHPEECRHEGTVSPSANGIMVCVECGEEVRRDIMHEKEWRYYGRSGGNGSDPNRIQVRKTEERSIYRDVESFGFSTAIVAQANEIYKQVTAGQVYRGSTRRAIIFACIFYAFKSSGNYQPPETLIRMFRITRKSGHRGLKTVNVHTTRESWIHHHPTATTEQLVAVVMDRFSASPEQKRDVVALYEATRNRSIRLNRAKPQSRIAAMTYYWILQNDMDISIKEFSDAVSVSPLTINKLVREIEAVLAKALGGAAPSDTGCADTQTP